MNQEYILTRNVTQKECYWLSRTYPDTIEEV